MALKFDITRGTPYADTIVRLTRSYRMLGCSILWQWIGVRGFTKTMMAERTLVEVRILRQGMPGGAMTRMRN